MTLSEIKAKLADLKEIRFVLPDGKLVPSHFHVTEVGKIKKHFIDCGGTVREEERINFQLWSTDDYDHRLHPEKLLHIIELSETKLGLGDYDIEVEYQSDTIGKYGLDFDGISFLLTYTQTDCLAPDACQTPRSKPKIKLSELQAGGNCAPGSGCC